ncbi:MAG TPA: acyltransferase [Isosphaeraceae bacterium]|jgi:peptidoglycan/LPS O-acetylase OafA/YrhL|nr:acyltransferase [Isosphaeraceae bacterium]
MSAIAAQPPRSASQGERVYYPELDGLRFVAFILVYLFHNGVADLSGLVGPAVARTMLFNGWVGVQLFFVLSGFLITTLLLREEARYGRLDLKAFWVRRILRIWPLYYLTVAIAFGLLPWADGAFGSSAPPSWVGKHVPAFLLFLGNWSMVFHGPVATDAQSVLWSVCVEEQFYVVCPLLLAFVPNRLRLACVLGLMVGSIAVRCHLAQSNPEQFVIQYNSLAQFDTLLSGIALALLLARFPPGRRADRFAGWLQWPLYAGIGWLLSRPGLAHGNAWNRTVDFAAIWLACAGVVAVAVLHAGGLRRFLANPPLVWLGKISYGLYMYHEVALWLHRQGEERLRWFTNEPAVWSVLTLGMTIGLATLSYYGVERYFLRLKGRWTRVPSRPV